MDFSVLSKYDDLLASYFLDSFYLWFSTVRMNMDFVLPKLDTAPIVDVIRDKIVKQRDPSKAALEFLKLPYFQTFLQDKSDKRKSEFTQHLKRYMYMFMPNAGFEISSTERYTGQKEACIVATRDWEAGEQMTCCQGAIAELNSEEDARLKKEGRDFSVMVSTRKKCTCLFLGPARFMNHDCDANCEFILLNQNAITFRINRNIAQGEEMTVFYGEHYFGEDNCECLCASCERRKEGSFSIESEVASPTSNDNNSNNNSNNNNDSNDGKSPIPSLSLPSSFVVKKNPTRKSSRKRKEISYTDYFEPIEPKKARRGRSAKYMEFEEEPLNELLLLEQSPSPSLSQQQQQRQQQQHQYADSVTSSNCSVDLDSTQTHQNYSQKKKKKIESTRHHEMNLSFICENMTTPNDSCHQWVHISAYPTYDPLKHLVEKKVSDEAHWTELALDVKSMGRQKCSPGEAVLVPVPPLLYSAYNPTRTEPVLSDVVIDFSKMKEEEESQLLSQFFEWTDRLSDISEPEEDFSSPCCVNYDQDTADKVTNMCVRCHRHYSIYGIRWPIRKIRRAPVKRRTQKKVHKQVTQQTIQQEPSPASTVSTSTPPSFLPIPPSLSPRHITQTLPTSSSSSSPPPPPPPPTAKVTVTSTATATNIAKSITTTASSTLLPPSIHFLPAPPTPPILTSPTPRFLIAPPPPTSSPPPPQSPQPPQSQSPQSQSQSQSQSPQISSTITNDTIAQPQKIISDTIDTTIDELKVTSLSYQPLISDTISIQRLRHSLHYSDEMEFENNESSIGSNRCSSQFNSLVSHVSIDLCRD